MGDLYEGQPDARQSQDPALVTRFRPRYRQLSEGEIALHDAIKDKAEELALLYERVFPGRYRALGLTALEESVMWAVKELTGAGLNQG